MEARVGLPLYFEEEVRARIRMKQIEMKSIIFGGVINDQLK